MVIGLQSLSHTAVQRREEVSEDLIKQEDQSIQEEKYELESMQSDENSSSKSAIALEEVDVQLLEPVQI